MLYKIATREWYHQKSKAKLKINVKKWGKAHEKC